MARLRRPRVGVPRSQFVDRTVRQPDQPPVSFSYGQSEAREQRRRGFGHFIHYEGFDVVAEVREQAGPVAAEIAGLLSCGEWFFDPRRAEVGRDDLWHPGFHVIRVAEAAHRLRDALVKAMADVLPVDGRGRLADLVGDRAFREPVAVTNELLVSGAWVDGLVASVEPLSADLAGLVAAQPAERVSLLDHAISDAFRGPNAWDGFDHSVRDLVGQIPRLRRSQQAHRRWSVAAAEEAAELERRRAGDELRRLGLS